MHQFCRSENTERTVLHVLFCRRNQSMFTTLNTVQAESSPTTAKAQCLQAEHLIEMLSATGEVMHDSSY